MNEYQLVFEALIEVSHFRLSLKLFGLLSSSVQPEWEERRQSFGTLVQAKDEEQRYLFRKKVRAFSTVRSV